MITLLVDCSPNSSFVNSLISLLSLFLGSFLKTPSTSFTILTLKEIISALSPKEAVIICLRLGYVNERYFSVQEIATFLKMEEKDVRDVITNVLKLYRNYVNQFVDSLIDNVTEASEVNPAGMKF